MILKDDIYGSFEVNDPIIIDLIRTYPLRRLKGIDMAGYSESYFPGTGRSRYDHSLGVFLLLRKYDAEIEEQVAGLIHDVSHYAFSHAIDHILTEGDTQKQDLQDNIFDNFVRNSDVATILKRYGCDIEYVLNESNFPLKEKVLPDLCADRIDYCLNNILRFNYKTLEEVQNMLSHLHTYQREDWYFDTKEYALEFAKLFKQLNDNEYSGVKSASMFKSIKDVMKYSLDKGYIQKGDFSEDDSFVLSKIVKYVDIDTELNQYWSRMSSGFMYENNPKEYDDEVWCKSRVVDPYFIEDGNLVRLSERDSDWKKIVEEELEPKHYFFRAGEEEQL